MPRKRGRGSRAEKHVEKLYRKAGYKVYRNIRSRVGEIDLIAKRGKEKLVIEVKSGRQKITSREIKKLLRKASYHHGKPVLRHSPRSSPTSKAKKLAKKKGVRIRTY